MSPERDFRILKRVALLGLLLPVLQVLLAMLENKYHLLGRIPPMSSITAVLAIGVFEGEERLALPLGLGAWIVATALAYSPVWLGQGGRQRLAPLLLLTTAGFSLWAWIGFWPQYQGYGTKRILVFAAANVALAAACADQRRRWRRAPEGPAHERLPLLMQLWLQTLWIPFPYDD